MSLLEACENADTKLDGEKAVRYANFGGPGGMRGAPGGTIGRLLKRQRFQAYMNRAVSLNKTRRPVAGRLTRRAPTTGVGRRIDFPEGDYRRPPAFSPCVHGSTSEAVSKVGPRGVENSIKRTCKQKRGTLGSLWGHFGVILGSCWGHPGVSVGSFWGLVGVIFGSSS